MCGVSMRNWFISAVMIFLVSGCQFGSETILRSKNEAKSVSLEMAPRGWYQGKFDDPLMTWDEAHRVLDDINIGGRSGWRLPTGEEMLVLCGGFENPVCFSSDYEVPELNYAMNDPDLPREMIRYGKNAEKKKHWWWLGTSMEDDSIAVAMAPNYVRTFANKAEKFAIRPVRGVLGKNDHPSMPWEDDRQNVNSGGCYTESRDSANVAWMKSCSSKLLCGEMQVRGCALGMTSVDTDKDRTMAVVVDDSTLDTYEYASSGRWTLAKQQSLLGLLDPDRIDALVASVSFVDFTGDGLLDLAIRIGPPDFGTASWNRGLALFTWVSDSQGWKRVEVPFADGQDYRENGLLRWGYLDGQHLFEDVSYSGDFAYVDDVFFHFIWENGGFKYLGVIEKPSSR